MGGAQRITNLMADLLKLIPKLYLPIYIGTIVSSTSTLIAKRGPDYHVVHIAHSALTVASFPIGLSPRTMQDLGSVGSV